MNKIMMTGRICQAPELSKTSNDKAYVRATLAVNRRFKNDKGTREADFIPMVIWGKSAEIFASYAKKGALLGVEGELRTRRFTDKQGQNRSSMELLVLAFELLESRSTMARRENPLAHVDQENLVLEGEDLPF